MDYKSFFNAITGNSAFHYQEILGVEPLPDLLNIPTGLGKTAAIVVSWLWKRLHQDHHTPRRLIYCLPMRVLVEQTYTNTGKWLEKSDELFQKQGLSTPKAYMLMGGDMDDEWESYPEKDAILIGTQDMLLSRALMRGYAMSRYKWPVHFALLHNDALWVFDEIQLMGAGLATSAQLEAFRRKFNLGRGSKSLWMSATLDSDWLGTVDFHSDIPKLKRLSVGDTDRSIPIAAQRLEAEKTVSPAGIDLPDNKKETVSAYVSKLAKTAVDKRSPNTDTLIIVNRVDRAQAIYRAIKKMGIPSEERLLLHARFRPAERREIEKRLKIKPLSAGRIIVATQAIEAGLDITSSVLFTEIAPMPSLIQRFGRCNRYGEMNGKGGGQIFWIDLGKDKELALPYTSEELDAAKKRLETLTSVSPAKLSDPGWNPPLAHVLRKRDFIDLFNTDPDLSGFDVDISPFIRDEGQPQIHVFWRNWDGDSPTPDFPSPVREELCPASIGQIKKMKSDYFIRDSVAGKWVPLKGDPRPGMTLLLKSSSGGYDPETGFDSTQKKQVSVIDLPESPDKNKPESLDEDNQSFQNLSLELQTHLMDVEDEIESLSTALCLDESDTHILLTAGRWHDVGKAHKVFQDTMFKCLPSDAFSGKLLAKSPCKGKHSRKYFRHELASALTWLLAKNNDKNKDIVAYLIAAHHGKVRMSLRAWHSEKIPPPEIERFARGIWEGDIIPAFAIGERDKVEQTRLTLDIMELGEGAMGPSWSARVTGLLDNLGPFKLAWLESLLRIADWRASSKRAKEN